VTPPAELTVTQDSEGAADARTDVDLTAGRAGDAWVGLAGNATLTGRVVDTAGTPVTGTVQVRWFGPDEIVRTRDDIVIVATVIDGTLSTSGLPAGRYTVEQAGTTVPVELRSGRTTTLSAAPASLRARPELPFTGAPTGVALLAGLCSLVVGIALAALGRRAGAAGEE
jgi:hypothetical protein